MRPKIYPFLALFFLAFASPLHAEEPLTWQQCLSEAKEAHPDLYSALAVLQQAEADKLINRGSLLPQISAALSGKEGGTLNGGSGYSTGYSLSAQQLLYDGQKSSRQVLSNEEAIKAAQYNYKAVSANLRFALRSAFTELLKAQDLVGLAGEIAKRRQKNLRLISLRYKGGREHLGSFRQAEADKAQADFELGRAERGLLLARTKLASALGGGNHQNLAVQGDFNVKELPLQKPNLPELAKNSPLFQQLDSRSKGARFDLDAAKSAFSPQLYLTSSIGRNAYDRMPTDALDWSAGVTVAVPIYGGGSGNARVSKAMAVVSQLNAQEKSGYLQLLDSIEGSWKDFVDAQQNVAVQKKFLDAAVERSTIANSQYSNGLITFNDWVIIEDNLVNAKKNFLNAGADLLIAEAKWIQAKGGGVESE